MLLSGGRDRLAFVGDNVVRQSLLAIGGASQDSYHVPVNSRFDRDPTMLEFESSSIDGIDSLLDEILEELAEQGLGGLL